MSSNGNSLTNPTNSVSPFSFRLFRSARDLSGIGIQHATVPEQSVSPCHAWPRNSTVQPCTHAQVSILRS